MGHHYLPQHYLRGFATDKTIWAHDLHESRSYKSQVKSVANETAMYTEDLEAHLANSIEGPAQKAIDSIRALRLPAGTEREALAHYIVTMWKRVPAARTRVAATVPQVADTINAEIQQGLDQIAKDEPELADLAASRKQEVANLIAAYKQNPPDYFWHHSVGSHATPRMVQGLLEMQWTVLHSESEHFVSSDNPVFFFESEGIGSPQSELSIPFGSSVALWATRGRPHSPSMLQVDRGVILEINRRSARNAQRFLYTMRESPWAVSFGKKPHSLRRLW